MVVAYPSVMDAPPLVQAAPEPLSFSQAQSALMALVHNVRNVQDENDLQCVAFLAVELGILRPSPFYFSYDPAEEVSTPCSLILRDTLHALLVSHHLGWDHGALRLRTDMPPTVHEVSGVASTASWLGALSPSERGIFARVTMDLHRRGIGVLSHRAEMLFRRAVARLLGAGAGEDAGERRLSTVRRQLSLA